MAIQRLAKQTAWKSVLTGGRGSGCFLALAIVVASSITIEGTVVAALSSYDPRIADSAADSRATATARPVSSTVRPGDAPRSIAAELLHDEGRWREIRNLNQVRIGNPDRMQVAGRLRTPQVPLGTALPATPTLGGTTPPPQSILPAAAPAAQEPPRRASVLPVEPGRRPVPLASAPVAGLTLLTALFLLLLASHIQRTARGIENPDPAEAEREPVEPATPGSPAVRGSAEGVPRAPVVVPPRPRSPSEIICGRLVAGLAELGCRDPVPVLVYTPRPRGGEPPRDLVYVSCRLYPEDGSAEELQAGLSDALGVQLRVKQVGTRVVCIDVPFIGAREVSTMSAPTSRPPLFMPGGSTLAGTSEYNWDALGNILFLGAHPETRLLMGHLLRPVLDELRWEGLDIWVAGNARYVPEWLRSLPGYSDEPLSLERLHELALSGMNPHRSADPERTHRAIVLVPELVDFLKMRDLVLYLEVMSSLMAPGSPVRFVAATKDLEGVRGAANALFRSHIYIHPRNYGEIPIIGSSGGLGNGYTWVLDVAGHRWVMGDRRLPKIATKPGTLEGPEHSEPGPSVAPAASALGPVRCALPTEETQGNSGPRHEVPGGTLPSSRPDRQKLRVPSGRPFAPRIGDYELGSGVASTGPDGQPGRQRPTASWKLLEYLCRHPEGCSLDELVNGLIRPADITRERERRARRGQDKLSRREKLELYYSEEYSRSAAKRIRTRVSRLRSLLDYHLEAAGAEFTAEDLLPQSSNQMYRLNPVRVTIEPDE